ncbi:Uncharacterized conserved protein [Niallia circulans]|uniref:DUF262 domain-containing protein n=1 Tax=Niallia circulans TaxID=1397 RepID=UPI00077C4963|nr:DUF262 domain-containing protein [Niallia circulans]MDR4314468.1 DUF262 domain-containing protein [Niallia circulans]MED3839552.1 DUF262 domain-containing protein [Niallia circulans]MED4242624.1 DUF262 domain-containing protein [Niallia circulans]MED4246602.1 DUF262 domain-containing protein [Niallia circulans]QKH62148.1 DUF262 domain-containing protein [Niallia circulans]
MVENTLEINKLGYQDGIEAANIENEENDPEFLEEVEVTTRGVDFSVRELVTMLKEEELITPKFQRELVWDKKRKSRFIESILLGFPIPGMFFSEKGNHQLLIIDGQQRLGALKEFLNNELRISKSEQINPKWRGSLFKDLEPDYQRKVRTTNIRASVFRTLPEEEENNIALYGLFERINTGSVQLNAQEIRNAIYPSYFTEQVKEVVDNPIWKSAYKNIDLITAERIDIDNRLHDQEIITRYFMLNDKYKNESLDSDISFKKELTKFLLKMSKIENEQIDREVKEFLIKLNWLKDQGNFLGFLFRKPKEELMEKYKISLNVDEIEPFYKGKRFHTAIFEAIMTAIDAKELEKLSFDLKKYLTLLQDQKFLEAITVHTNKFANINYRIETVKKVLQDES